MKTEQEIQEELTIASNLLDEAIDNEDFGKAQKINGYIQALRFSRGLNKSIKTYTMIEYL